MVTPEPSAETSPSSNAPAFNWDWAIRTYDRQIFLSLLAMGLGPERARELTQRTWARLFERHTEGTLTEIRLPGLAIRQARFIALDSLKQADANVGEPDALDAIEDPTDDPEARVLGREQLGRAQEVLLGCPPSSQRVFRMVYDHPGLPHRTVAQQVGLSVQRVRQILCEVRKAVREAIEEDV